MNEGLEHYHDTGEFAISRELADYQEMLFQEDSVTWLQQKPEQMTPSNPQEWSLRHYHLIEHYLPQEETGRIDAKKDESIAYEWDWKEPKVFGGYEGFFQKDSRILDLGSGKGRAVKEINKQFHNQGIEAIGVDNRYFAKPENDERLIAANFDSLPFPDSSFNRFLGVESFPSWLPKEAKEIDKYLQEITRVAEVGAIWRATLPSSESEDKESVISVDELVEKVVKNGWETLVSTHNGSLTMASKLLLKP